MDRGFFCSNRGFTSLEFLISFMIVAFLLIIAAPIYKEYKKDAYMYEAIMNLTQMADYCRYKTEKALVTPPSQHGFVLLPPLEKSNYFQYDAHPVCDYFGTSIFTAIGINGTEVAGETVTVNISMKDKVLLKIWGGTLLTDR